MHGDWLCRTVLNAVPFHTIGGHWYPAQMQMVQITFLIVLEQELPRKRACAYSKLIDGV
jgi:hypothetical protein